MAPEMLKMEDPKHRGKGYSKSVDWWSLGVMLYELLSGQNPFLSVDILSLARHCEESTAGKEQIDADAQVVSAELFLMFQKLDDCGNPVSDSMMELVKGFVTVEVDKRLG